MRTDKIEAFFKAWATRVGCIAIPLNSDRWEAEVPAEPSGVHRPYGWMPPYQRVPQLFVFRFCPTIIDSQTAHLSDDRMEEYLDAVAFVSDLHITNWERSDDERNRLVDRVLYDVAPGSFTLLTEVQMKSMEETIA